MPGAPAVLAAEAVTGEDRAARNAPAVGPGDADVVEQPDDRGLARERPLRPHEAGRRLDGLGLALEQQHHGAMERAHVHRLVGRVQHQNLSGHASSPCPPRASATLALDHSSQSRPRTLVESRHGGGSLQLPSERRSLAERPAGRPHAARARSTRSWGSATCWPKALRFAWRIETGTVGSMIFFGPPGTGKTTVARLVAAAVGRRLRGAVRGQFRRGRGAPGASTRPATAGPRAGPPDRALHRRDPPLLQGPAGRAPARRRGRDSHAHRGLHREPLFRSHPGPDLALRALPVRAAVAGRHPHACSIGR